MAIAVRLSKVSPPALLSAARLPTAALEYDAHCSQRFKSYDPGSGTHLGYDGTASSLSLMKRGALDSAMAALSVCNGLNGDGHVVKSPLVATTRRVRIRSLTSPFIRIRIWAGLRRRLRGVLLSGFLRLLTLVLALHRSTPLRS
ncbi:BA14K family protein [Bradyrhizobium sp. AZCC 1614]